MSQLSNSPSSVQHVRLIFFLVIIAYFMDIIDASIVTVALPSIRLEFGASIANSQWIYGAYAITLAGFLLLMGRAGDIYGQKKIFVGGLVIFTIASFTGGIAPSLLSLIISRSVQGIGAAMTTVTAFERCDRDRKSTRLNSSHSQISYAVFCLKKKNNALPVRTAVGIQCCMSNCHLVR